MMRDFLLMLDLTDGLSFFRSNRYGRVRLDSIPELPLEASTTGLQNLQTFSVSELKSPEEGVEETVVYFNTDSGLGIGIEGVTIQGGLEEVTNIDGVTIQAIGENPRAQDQTLLKIILSLSQVLMWARRARSCL